MWRLKFSTVKLSSTSTNPRCLIPTIAWNKWIVRLDDGSLVRFGSLGVMWLWRQWWVCLIHSERWAKYLVKLDKIAYDNHVNLLRDPLTRDCVRKLPGDDKLIKEFQVSEAMAKMYAEADANFIGIAAYSNDPNAPVASFSSKKVHDRYSREITSGLYVQVNDEVVVLVDENINGNLVFSPYNNEQFVKEYNSSDLKIVVPIGKDRTCECVSCPLGKIGASIRCDDLTITYNKFNVSYGCEIKK